MAFVYVLQHHEKETLGTVKDALHERRIEPRLVAGFAGEPIPRSLGDAAGLVILGGPMGVSDQEHYPFLADELRLISDALGSGAPILGICLGGQLLAHALGAAVTTADRPEIGWHSLRLTQAAQSDGLWGQLTSPCAAFHWHGDIFSLPTGAVALASSELTPCQAFRFGANAYGLQCHLEVTWTLIEHWLEAWAEELPAAGVTAGELQAQARQFLPEMERAAHTVFGAWADLIVS